MSTIYRISVLHSPIVNQVCKSVLKIKFSGSRKFLILKAGLGELRSPCNLVLFMSLRGVQVHPVVCLVVDYFQFFS